MGHTLSSKGIEMQMEMAQWVLDMAAPNDTHGVRSFLGLASYYRRFIKRFAKMAKTLTAMLTAKSIFKWGPGEQSSFVKLRQVVAKGPILMQPNFKAIQFSVPSFLVATDASDYALGGVLSQMDEDGNERPIYFHSRKFTSAKANYATTEKERLAVVSSMQKFRPYI